MFRSNSSAKSGVCGVGRSRALTLRIAVLPVIVVAAASGIASAQLTGITPNPVSFTAPAFNTAPAAQTVTPAGVAATNLTITGVPSWLTGIPATDTLPTSWTATVALAGTTPGATYNATISINDGVTTTMLPVSLVVPAAPLTVTSSSLTFSSAWNATPAAQTVSIFGGGYQGMFTVNVPNNCPWLTPSVTAGNTPGVANQNLSLAVSPAGIVPGSVLSCMVAVVPVNTDLGPARTLTVGYTVAPAALTVDKPSLTFASPWNTAPTPLTISVFANGYVGMFNVNVPNTCAWLTPSAVSGGTPAVASQNVSFAVNPAGLIPGTAVNCPVTVTRQNADLTPASVSLPVSYTPAAAPLTVDKSSLTFTSSWNNNPAAPAQTIAVWGGGSVGNFNLQVPNTCTWLTPSIASGATPTVSSQNVSFSVAVGALTPGTPVNCTVTIAPAGTDLSPSRTLAVSYTPAAAPLTVDKPSLTFTSTWNDNPAVPAQTAGVWAGGYVGNFNVQIPNTCPWLSSPLLSIATANVLAQNVSFNVSAAGLTPGTPVNCTVTFAPAATDLAPSRTLAVTYTPAAAPLTVDLSSLNFISPRWNTAPSSQTLKIFGNGYQGLYTVGVGQAGVAWQVSLPAWLSINPAAGSQQTTPGVLTSNLTVSVDPTGLTPGHTYSGTLTVTPVNGDLVQNPNPLTVAVTYTVPPALFTVNAGASAGPAAALTFTSPRWNTAPAAQSVAVFGDGYSGNYTVTIPNSAPWLTANPAAGATQRTTPASATQNLTLTVSPTNLTPGAVYSTTVTIAPVNPDLSLNAPTLNASPLLVTVSYTVPPALLTVNGTNSVALDYSSPKWNVASSAQTVNVFGDGYQGNFRVTIPGAATWLTATPAAGTTQATPVVSAANVSFGVNPAGLAPNRLYTAVVTIANVNNDLSTTAPTLNGPPLQVTIRYYVPPAQVLLSWKNTGGPGKAYVSSSVGANTATLTVDPATIAQGVITEPLQLYADGYLSPYSVSAVTVSAVSRDGQNAPLDRNLGQCLVPSGGWLKVNNTAVPPSSPAAVNITASSAAGAPYNTTLLLDPSALSPGCTYTATVTFANTDAPATITGQSGSGETTTVGPVVSNFPPLAGSVAGMGTITATVKLILPPLRLGVSPSSGISFNYGIGGGNASQSQQVSVNAFYDNSNGLPAGQAAVPYKVTAVANGGGSWLSANATGTTSSNFTITANAAGLNVGSYAGTVTVSPTALPGVGTVPIPSSVNIPVSLTVTGATTFTVSPKSISLVVDVDASKARITQTISVFSSLPGVTFSASSSGAGFSATGSGSTPGNVSVIIDPTSLQVSQLYGGTIDIAANNAVGKVSVPVSIRTVGRTPVMAVTAGTFNLSFNAGAPVSTQSVTVYNTGGGTLNFDATVTQSNCGDAWLTIPVKSGNATVGGPSQVVFAVDPSSQVGQTCTAAIQISGSDGKKVSVPVSMVVSPATLSLQLSATGLSFTSASGSKAPVPPAQSLSILNPGSSSLAWSIDTASLPTWLKVSSSSGTSQGGDSNSGAVAVSLNGSAASLAPKTYYGTVKVNAPAARNSPQSVTVALTVLPAGQSPQPVPSSSGLVFVGLSGGDPASQTITIYNPGISDLSFTTVAQADDGASWLSASSSASVVPSGGSATLSVKAATFGIPAGQKHGTVRLAFVDPVAGTVTATLTIDVSLNVITPTGILANSVQSASPQGVEGSDAPGGRLLPHAGNGCQPSAAFVSPSSSSAVTPNSIVPVQVVVKDCSGNPLNQPGQASVAVTITVGNSIQQFPLSAANGVWVTSNWVPPATTADIPAKLEYRVITNGGLQGTIAGSAVGSLQVTISGGAGLTKPSPQAVLNAASLNSDFPNVITPGSWVAIYGPGITSSDALSGTPPYQKQLGGTSVFLQGIQLALFGTSAGQNQVNALIPQGVLPNEQQQLIVVRDGTQSVGIPLSVSAVQPAIFTTAGNGTGQGAIINVDSGTVAAPAGTPLLGGAAPVKLGRMASIYCTGLGEVVGQVADGEQTPATVLYPLKNPGGVSVLVGDTAGAFFTAKADFAGLAPFLVGVYQVNFAVPAAGPTGGAVPITLQIGNLKSNTVTMAVSQ